MKLWCFGDSNTYGFDPCGFFGGRYSAPWPSLLAEKTGLEVINDGKNGRKIPEGRQEFLQFRRDAEQYNADMLIVMLGTNDLLEGAKAGEVARRMEVLLTGCTLPITLLVSPPPMKRGAWVPDDGLVEASRELSGQYKALAERLGLRYADAGSGISISPSTASTSRKRGICTLRKDWRLAWGEYIHEPDQRIAKITDFQITDMIPAMVLVWLTIYNLTAWITLLF